MVASPDRDESWGKLLSCVTGQVQRDWGDCSEENHEGQLALAGLHRIDPRRVEWHEVKANKDRVCIRGCAIKRNAVYYQLQNGAGWGKDR
jgi:hypothetical protein